MRRNRNTSLGGGGGNLSRASDPFLTDHLKDIDLELDLLKRKREMLEQQQQFIQPLMAQRSFNQQPYYQLEPKQSGSNRDFSHLYNDGSRESRKPYGRKRQSDSDWRHDSYPKRSAGQGQRGPSDAGPSFTRSQRPYGGKNQQPRSTPNQYGQGKQFIGQRISNQKQQKPSKNFVPNKVTKASKAFVPPNKPASRPVVGRSKMVAAAVMSMAKVETQDREALRLLPDQEPTKQMTGRLELALGAILRNIRDLCAESSHHEILRTTSLQRVIKQAIRERIRSAMLGKIVGATQDIVKEYRDMYPKETDLEIMNIALEAGGIKPEKDPKPIVQQKDRSEEYYKVNLIKLIDTHLQEMFDKIENIYKAENEIESSQEGTGENNNMDTSNEPVGEKGENSVEATDQENEAITNEADAEKSSIVEADRKENHEAANGDNSQAVRAGNISAPNNENIAVTNDESIANRENGDGDLLFPHANEYKRMLPRLLKRHIPTIINLLHLNKMYKRALHDITTSSKAKFEEYDKPENSGKGETAQISQTPRKFLGPYVALPYYVKVMGKPQLPKKKVMNTFLEAFNPKSIKKHRTIHNLLFIGFTEKADFDALVQADGTVIGRSTLSIRVCDKNIGKCNEKAQNDTLSGTNNQNVSQVQEALDISLNKKNIKEESGQGEDLANELNEEIIDLIESIENDGIKSETQEGKKANENIGEAAELTKYKDEVVNSNEVLGDTEVVQDSDKAKGNSEIVVGDSDKVVTDNDKVDADSDKIDVDSDKVVADSDKVVADNDKVDADSDKIDADSDKIDVDSDKVVADSDKVVADNDKVDADSDKIDADSDKIDVDSDKVVADNDKVDADSDKVDADSDKVVADSDKIDADSDKVVADSDKVDTDNDKAVADSDEVPKGTDELPTETEKTENTEEKQSSVDEKKDQLAQLRTPTRASTRLANTSATPSTIKTRRASRLMQN